MIAIIFRCPSQLFWLWGYKLPVTSNVSILFDSLVMFSPKPRKKSNDDMAPMGPCLTLNQEWHGFKSVIPVIGGIHENVLNALNGIKHRSKWPYTNNTQTSFYVNRATNIIEHSMGHVLLLSLIVCKHYSEGGIHPMEIPLNHQFLWLNHHYITNQCLLWTQRN